MRGCEKKVIHLKNTGSPFFDEAIFIVSKEGEEVSVVEGDMVVEANRIIKESLNVKEKKILWRGRKIVSFAIPFFLGAFVSAATMFLIIAIS